jgi:AcrR family transcriptional regulator
MEETTPPLPTFLTEGGDRRKRLIQATLTVLAREGYERITTRRIAVEANVNIATLHYYFGTKENLMTEAVRQVRDWTIARMEEGVEDAPDTACALRSAFQIIWESIQHNFGTLRYDMAIRGFRDNVARREVETVYDAYRAFLFRLLERHQQAGGTLAAEVTSEDIVHYILYGVDGTVLHYTLTGNMAAAQTNLRLLQEHVLSMMYLPPKD